MISEARTQALDAAKEAIRAYSKEPTERNAVRVEAAWRAVRTLDAVSAWRQKRLHGREPARASMVNGTRR